MCREEAGTAFHAKSYCFSSKAAVQPNQLATSACPSIIRQVHALFATIDIDFGGGISLGELLVAIGTLALAAVTKGLASTTKNLGETEVDLDRERRKREVRGVARLVADELDEARSLITEALRGNQWEAWFSPTRSSFDRAGAVIVSELPWPLARVVANAFSVLREWESTLPPRQLDAPPVPIPKGSPRRAIVEKLAERVENALTAVRTLEGIPPHFEQALAAAGPDQSA